MGAAGPGRVTEAVCPNCGEPMPGSYCSRCGQSDTDLDVPIRQFAGEFISESFDLDSRLRRTLGPLFLRPGLVAAEYVAGHRARFVPPVRLYVFASFVLFLVLSLTTDGVVITTSSGLRSDTAAAATDSASVPAADGEGGRFTLPERIVEGIRRAQEDPSRFSEVFLARTAQGMFVLLPVFALVLKGLYRRRFYVHHLVFSVYFHSFAFFLVAAVELVESTGLPVLSEAAGLGVLAIPGHLLLGLKRFHGDGWVRATLKWVVVSVAYGVLLGVTMSMLVLITLLAGDG